MTEPVSEFAGQSDRLHTRFLEIMPRIENHARICFRDIRCPDKKADRIAEVVALAWAWFQRLMNRGKDATAFPMVLADFAVRHVRSGRRITGQLKPHDVLSERAQREHGFTLDKLPDFSTLNGNPYDEALQDRKQSDVPTRVAFKFDFGAWRAGRTDRDRRLIDEMATGERTGVLARRFRVSPGRISQLREEFRREWRRFLGELPTFSQPVATPA